MHAGHQRTICRWLTVNANARTTDVLDLALKGSRRGRSFEVISSISFQFSNSVFGLRVEPWPKTHRNRPYRAETGRCRISADIRSHTAVKASWAIICTGLSNGGLILVLAAIFSDRCTSLTLFCSSALLVRFLHHGSYLGPPMSVLLDPKCVAPGYMFSEAMFQVSK